MDHMSATRMQSTPSSLVIGGLSSEVAIFCAVPVLISLEGKGFANRGEDNVGWALAQSEKCRGVLYEGPTRGRGWQPVQGIETIRLPAVDAVSRT